MFYKRLKLQSSVSFSELCALVGFGIDIKVLPCDEAWVKSFTKQGPTSLSISS